MEELNGSILQLDFFHPLADARLTRPMKTKAASERAEKKRTAANRFLGNEISATVARSPSLPSAETAREFI